MDTIIGFSFYIRIDIAIGNFGKSLTSPLKSLFLKFIPILSNSITFSQGQLEKFLFLLTCNVFLATNYSVVLAAWLYDAPTPFLQHIPSIHFVLGLEFVVKKGVGALCGGAPRPLNNGSFLAICPNTLFFHSNPIQKIGYSTIEHSIELFHL